jgi:hypothetical protein
MFVEQTAIPISSLPRIEDIWLIEERPHLVVFRYDEFVKFVIAADPDNAPDINSVLVANNENQFVTVGFEDILGYMRRFSYDGIIDDVHYAKTHQDVREAMNNGKVSRPFDHYVLQGYFERRSVRILDPAAKRPRPAAAPRPAADE